MNKSLLRILKTEDDILNDITCCEHNIAMYIEWQKDEDCSEYYANLVAAKKEQMVELNAKLESTRSEMRDYFAMLFGKGGENNG
jgi:hypothetical protein